MSIEWLFDEGCGGDAGFLKGFWDGYGFSALTDAFVSGFHEGHDFEGFVEADRRRSGAEEAADGAAERFVADGFSSGFEGFGAVDHGAELGLSFHDAVIGADAPIVPSANRLIIGGGLGALDGGAAGAHEGEEGFHAVDGVEEQIRRSGLVGAGAPGGGTEDVADFVRSDEFAQIGSESGGRTREAGNVVTFREFGNGDRFRKIAGEGFIDEHGFAGLERFLRFFEVNPAVDTF